MNERRKRSLADELADYGRNSWDSFRRGAQDLGALARELEASAPPQAIDVARFFLEDLPGAGVRKSMRLGNEAGRLYRQGDYFDALDAFADAVDAPIQEVWWALPGGGLVPKVAK